MALTAADQQRPHLARLAAVSAVGAPPDSVLARAFSLLEVIAAAPEPLGPSDLARITGLPKSTVFRMARELVALKALKPGRRGYRIGLGLFELGNQHYPSNVRDAVQPFLADLCRATGLTVRAGLLDGPDVAYLHRVVPQGGGATRRRTELRVPAYASAAGKVLLAALPARRLAAMIAAEPGGAESDSPDTPMLGSTSAALLVPDLDRLREQLERVRRDGHACEYGQLETGLASIAVLVPNPGLRAIPSALELRGPTDKLRPAEVLSAARITASAIARVAARAEARPRSKLLG